MFKRTFQIFAKGPGRHGYVLSAPLIKALCKTRWGRKGAEVLMRSGGRVLFWAFEGKRQPNSEKIRIEWERILREIGIEPSPVGHHTGEACATCFSTCTLGLTVGDEKVCDTAMSTNDELVRLLGGKMTIGERLTDVGGSRCIVHIDSFSPSSMILPGERELWFEEEEAQQHFNSASNFYDFIMGYFEIPTNIKAVRFLSLKKGDLVLDLGTGTGLSLIEILKNLPAPGKVIAVDTSEKMLARSQKRLQKHGVLERVEFLRADASNTGLSEASIDAVYSSFLLDLLDVKKRCAILREIKRVLKPEGVGIIAVMDGAAPRLRDQILSHLYNLGYRRWNPLWKMLFKGYAPHCRPIRIQELLESEGFEIVRRDRTYVSLFPVAIYRIRPIYH